MPRPVTLFTGQWADLKFQELAELVAGFGYDGLELACWGDHFEVDKAVAEDNYCQGKRHALETAGLECHAISNHLVGQAVCDLIDERHKSILPAYVWGDGDPAGVNSRAAEEMKATARAARALGVDDGRHAVVGRDGQEFRLELLAPEDVDEVQIIGDAQFLEHDGDLASVGGR